MRYLTLLFAAAFALTGVAATSDPWCNGDPDCPEGQWCLEDKTCGVPPWKCGMLGLKCCNGKCALSRPVKLKRVHASARASAIRVQSTMDNTTRYTCS